MNLKTTEVEDYCFAENSSFNSQGAHKAAEKTFTGIKRAQGSLLTGIHHRYMLCKVKMNK